MQSMFLKSTRLLYEGSRNSSKIILSMAKHFQSTIDFVPPAPVRPINPYCRYLKEKLLLLKQVSGEDFKITKLVSKIAVEWKALPIDKKQFYEKQYADDIITFRILEEKWWHDLTENQKQQYKDLKTEKKLKKSHRKLQRELSTLGQPKKNISALNFFIRKNMVQNDPANMLSTRSNKEFCNLMKTLSNKWTTLSTDEKKIYSEMAEEDSNRYKRELAFWNLKMMKEGKGHLLQLIKNSEKQKRLEKKR